MSNLSPLVSHPVVISEWNHLVALVRATHPHKAMKTTILRSALMLLLVGCSETNLGEPPDATFVASVYQGSAPLAVGFSVTVAGDTDYTIDRYEWDFEDDGVVDATDVTSQSEMMQSHTYTAAGDYTPRVRVVFNEAEAFTQPLFGEAGMRSIVVTAAH